MEQNLSSAAGGGCGTRMAGNRTKSASAASSLTQAVLIGLYFLLQVLQLTKQANRPMERNLSSAAGGDGGTRMAGNRTKSDSVASNPSAAVNFIPINAAEACDDNLCFNGGFCDPLSLKCRCRGHFIGKFSRQIRAYRLFLLFLVELKICF